MQFITLLVHHPKRQFVLKSIHRKESSDFLRRKNIKTGTKSKLLRPVDKTTVMSSKSKSYRYLVLVKFVLFNIDYTYCDENHMVEEMCISHQ